MATVVKVKNVDGVIRQDLIFASDLPFDVARL